MEIAIVADTHMPRGSRRLPEACVARLRAADLIIHAGDLIEFSVLEELRGYGRVIAVHGNVDDPEVRMALPAVAVVPAAVRTSSSSTTPVPRAGGWSACAPAFPTPTRSSSATPTSHCTRAPRTAFRSSIRAVPPSAAALLTTRWVWPA